MSSREWKVLEQVLKLTCGVSSRITGLAKQEHLPATALKILILTSYSPFTCVSTLTDCTGLQKGRISPLVQHLVQRGFLSRHEGSDRRYSLLKLTSEGDSFLQEMMADEIDRIRRLVEDSSETEQGLLMEQLTKVADELGFTSSIPPSIRESA